MGRVEKSRSGGEGPGHHCSQLTPEVGVSPAGAEQEVPGGFCT